MTSSPKWYAVLNGYDDLVYNIDGADIGKIIHHPNTHE